MAKELLREQLGFQNIELYKNLTKRQIDEKLENLKELALKFEVEKQGKET